MCLERGNLRALREGTSAPWMRPLRNRGLHARMAALGDILSRNTSWPPAWRLLGRDAILIDGRVDFGTETEKDRDTTNRVAEETSQEYLGRWNRLVSTTNWEKGRIISEWRLSLVAAAMPIPAYSDEAWSRRVGNVSPQHVGRLRRVYEQFGDVHQQYAGLYWSHFQVALDWHDAEMWLEGAVQNAWSVAQMRRQRWEATGAAAGEEPRNEEVVSADMDEDAPPEELVGDHISDSIREVRDAEPEERSDQSAGDPPFDAELQDAIAPAPLVRPFEKLPPLPDDLREAFEAFKLAILAQKVNGWHDISRDALLAVLDGLRQLALAPTDG